MAFGGICVMHWNNTVAVLYIHAVSYVTLMVFNVAQNKSILHSKISKLQTEYVCKENHC